MAENTDVPENADENLTNEIPATPAPEPARTPVRLRDQVWSFRSMIAVAAATLLIGGAGGAGLVALTNGDNGRPERVGRFADGPDGREGFGGGPQFQRNGQQGQQGQDGTREAPPAPGSSS
jgi:hypothetical protein